MPPAAIVFDVFRTTETLLLTKIRINGVTKEV